jgi:hypothetical protein
MLIATEIKSGYSQWGIHGCTEFGKGSNMFKAQMAYISLHCDNLVGKNSKCVVFL